MNSTSAVELVALPPGSRLKIETKSRQYYVECVGGNAVRISGHPTHCPDPVAAHLHGSVDREGELGFGLIESGKRLIVLLDGDYPFTTSKVVRIHVEAPIAV
jgi:hypothetical protein